MAVTIEAFEAMPVTAYADARPSLRTGDIVLFNSQNLGSKIIEAAMHTLWSHAALVWVLPDVDRVMLLESMDTVGVRVMPMSTRIDGCAAAPTPFPGKILVLRHDQFPSPPDPAKLRLLTQFALDRVGFPYSFQELHQIALRIALGMAGDVQTGRLDPKNQFICSEYVAKCFDVMGIALAPDREGFIAPADIAADFAIQALFSLKPDAAPA